ncbi:MAG: hypothetical protein AB7Q17_16290 [Phycisphaerae bacterium]
MIVLAAATLVMIIGLAAIATTRIERRAQRSANDFAIARSGARSAIELGFAGMLGDDAWRDTYKSGVPWLEDVTVGGARLTLTVTDPTDNDLTDDPSDPVELVGAAVVGDARHVLRCRAAPQLLPLEALSTCLHSTTSIAVASAKRVVASGAALSTNGPFVNDGAVTGDIEAAALSGTGTISGASTVPAPAKAAPDAGVFARYLARATSVSVSGTLEHGVLAAGYSSFGASNADGVYSIATGGADLVIRGVRVRGTLVINAGSGTVRIREAVLLEPGRADYPALIVQGSCELDLDRASARLRESAYSTNFNPVGAPYSGASDNDTADTYPSELRGLVHVRGRVTFKQRATIRGVLIAEGAVGFDDDAYLEHDSTLVEQPPDGYTELGPMTLKAGSFERVVE